jgi:hypothetical protein
MAFIQCLEPARGQTNSWNPDSRASIKAHRSANNPDATLKNPFDSGAAFSSFPTAALDRTAKIGQKDTPLPDSMSSKTLAKRTTTRITCILLNNLAKAPQKAG